MDKLMHDYPVMVQQCDYRFEVYTNRDTLPQSSHRHFSGSKNATKRAVVDKTTMRHRDGNPLAPNSARGNPDLLNNARGD